MSSYAANKKLSAASRRGSVYVAVLGVAIIVAVIGISSVHVARLETREAVALDEMARARLYAQSGIECALAKIKSDPQWRETYVNNVTNSIPALAAVLKLDNSDPEPFEFKLTDTDGDLDDSKTDLAKLQCVGKAGNAKHVIEVSLHPSGAGLSCLSASLHAGGNIKVRGTINTDVVSSNGDIDASGSGASISGRAQAVGSITGIPATPPLNPALEMPDPELEDGVFEYYIEHGTPILYNELSGGKIERVLFSAGNNPYGSRVLNPEGIYVIDCGGNKVSILDSRIHATLVFLNASNGIEIEKSIVWAPSKPYFPAMLVDGNVVMKWDRYIPLSESSINVNLNPAHTPHETLGSNSNKTDIFLPGLISGIVYMTGDFEMEKQANIDGVIVVGGSVHTKDSLTIMHDPTYFTNAPPGFASGEMELERGTFKQVAY